MLPNTTSLANAIHPMFYYAHVLVPELAHRDHHHVQVCWHLIVQHGGDELTTRVVRLTAVIVAICEAHKPTLTLAGRGAWLRQHLQALHHSVIEGSATCHLRSHARQLLLKLRTSTRLGRWEEDRLHCGTKRDDANDIRIAHLILQDAIHALHADLEARLRRSSVSRHHGDTPVQAEDHHLRHCRHWSTARLNNCSGRWLLCWSEVLRLCRNAGWVKVLDSTERVVHVTHTHPPHALADVHHALARVGVLQQLLGPAEQVLAQLVDSHAHVVEGSRSLDFLSDLLVGPLQHSIDNFHASSGERLPKLLPKLHIVEATEHWTELTTSILPRSSPQPLSPFTL
mmetsp:Transcript_2998/g.8658  ORF Transcript_2998/g.8658 Transcript_2998/m.8658 type:complete len:341 (-) Transcript_2998:3173-4195(-)